MNSNSSTTQEQSGARKAQAAETAVQPDIAFRVAAILLGGTVVVVVSYSFLAFQTGAWQMFILAGAPVAFGVAILISMGLIRRGRPDLGMGIIIVGTLVIFPIASLLVTGIGLVLGLGVVLVNSTIVAQTLPQRYASRAISASVMVGVATLLLDLYGGDYRLAIPALQTFLPAIIGVLILIYGVFVALQFRDYTLRTKLVTAFVAVVAITMEGMSLITLQTVRSAFTEQIGENYTADAESLGRLVAGFLEAKTTEIVALAKLARERTNPQLIYRVLVTMYDRRNKICRVILEQMQQRLNSVLFETIIEVDTRLRESPAFGQPITLYAKTRGARQYRALSQELMHEELTNHER